VPVDEHADFKLRALTFGVIEGVQDTFTAIILLKVKSDDADTACCAGNFSSNVSLKVAGE
jgi:hypothetical protein